jgi:hypothetical protein
VDKRGLIYAYNRPDCSQYTTIFDMDKTISQKAFESLFEDYERQLDCADEVLPSRGINMNLSRDDNACGMASNYVFIPSHRGCYMLIVYRTDF